jgi:mono/diheme cytochrome c family protein
MNDWSFPVGTRFYKEFVVDGKRIETRLILRTGKGPYDFLYASYLWNDAETEATLVPKEGILQAKGTTHDIPSEVACRRCHGSHEKKGGRPSRALGFSAMQLNHDNAETLLGTLVNNERLTHAPMETLKVPGNDVERGALGYLHVNCGVCHNGTRDGVPQTDMNLWIDHDQTTVETTSTYLSTVGKANKVFNDQHVTARIEPNNPDKSSIIYRMSQRGNNAQMPPLATHQVDQVGVEAVKAWILSLP